MRTGELTRVAGMPRTISSLATPERPDGRTAVTTRRTRGPGRPGPGIGGMRLFSHVCHGQVMANAAQLRAHGRYTRYDEL